MDLVKNKYVLVGMIGVVGIILMAIIGAVLGGGKSGVKEQTIDLRVRLENTSSVISTYQPSVKSSELRSSSASLGGVISNTNKELSAYTESAYGIKSLSKEQQQSDENRRLGLEQELFEAKINGILDRIYAHKMSYEISVIMSMEGKLYDATSNDSLRTILNTSYNSLKNLQEKFSNFSEAN